MTVQFRPTPLSTSATPTTAELTRTEQIRTGIPCVEGQDEKRKLGQSPGIFQSLLPA